MSRQALMPRLAQTQSSQGLATGTIEGLDACRSAQEFMMGKVPSRFIIALCHHRLAYAFISPAWQFANMWCDNCLLIFPLRHGAMALDVFIALYSLAGSIFLFRLGQFFFFDYPEAQFYGGIGMAVMSICILNTIGLSNKSYMWIRVCFFVWPVILIAVVVRAAVMMFQLNRQQNKIIWECNNGGQLWGSSAEVGSKETQTMPGGVCSAGFHGLYIAFVLCLLLDFLMQLYAYFLCWRFKKRLEHYSKLPLGEGMMYGYGY